MGKNSFSIRVDKYIIWLIAAALGIKFVLFFYIAFVNSTLIMQPDSYGYLLDAKAWIHYFSLPLEGLRQSLYRTPGYPLFLAIFHFGLKLPLLSIVFLHIVLNIFTAIIVFKCFSPEYRLTGLLSAAIVLLDLPMTVYSTVILTESLYVFVLSLFLYVFMKYISNRRLGWLIGAAVLLGVSVYIRPVGFFLGVATAGFVLYLWGIKKIRTGMAHALVVIVLVYGFLGIWQYHNLKVHGEFIISSINRATINMDGIIGRYARETDAQFKAMPPVWYYVNSIGRNFLNLMTDPGSLRCFKSKILIIFGAIFGYLVVIFWWIGLVAYMKQCKKEVTEQFLLLVLLYFIFISLVSTGWHVTPRFRVPMLPSIAILSSQGWMALFYGKIKQV